MTPWSITTADAAATQAVAERIGRAASAGLVVCLIGEVGAGKTTFTQGLARGLGIREWQHVTSPTFTIVCEYAGGRFPLYHFDLYRLKSLSELSAIGYSEYLAESAVCVLEWADLFPDAAPENYLACQLVALPDGKPQERRLTFEAQGVAAEAVLDFCRKGTD